jgi:hypothetical protein
MGRRTSFGVSAALGAGAAALVIAVRPAPARLVPVGAGSGYAPPITASNNKRPLSATDRRTMLKWEKRVRRCAVRRGLPLGEPQLAANEFVMRPAGSPGFARIATIVGKCASVGAGPPTLTSFVVERDRLVHFYKPRACLLPIRKKP